MGQRVLYAGTVVLAVVLGACTTSPKATPASTTPSSAPATAAPAATSKAPSTTAAPKVLLSQQGSGTATTADFVAPTDWNLAWTYDCSNFGQSGNFTVTVMNKTGANAELSDQPVNQLGMSGNSVEHYHAGGDVYLTVSSECNWTIKATAA